MFVVHVQAMSYARLAGLEPIYGLCKFFMRTFIANLHGYMYLEGETVMYILVILSQCEVEHLLHFVLLLEMEFLPFAHSIL